MVRTRIAPSPTGYPHIGTIYQALFNFAYARKNKGQFVVRIEDTDRTRFVEGAEEKIFEALHWFGLQEDESPVRGGTYAPYRQSERLEHYQKTAKTLVEKGHAYYCFCTKERLDEVRKKMQEGKKPPMYDKHCRNLSAEEVEKNLQENMSWVIRLKVPQDKTITIVDGVRGEINFDSNLIDDQVLLKSDGFPTYHLGVVVDDNEMKITHVVRGEEWITSTPKHWLLYEYLGWEKPAFFHTALLRNPDKSKLSKRHSHTNVDWYKDQGFLPEALLNFLALMGWSHPENKEEFSLEEFIKLFDLKDMKPVGPTFDLKKLEWLNGEYIRRSEILDLTSQIYKFYGGKYPEDVIKKTVPLIQERIKKLSDYEVYCDFFFHKPEKYDVDISNRKDLFKHILDGLQNVDEWNHINIGESMQNVAINLGVKNSEFFMAMRVAITGKKISPPLNESMELLGQAECVARISGLV